ncbi:cytosine permease [Paracoccus fistulariae]|uniref:Cytosine permease n=1 Tax=Paracoccus fistulariae TaxID=658446 RepID=A0ABY7SLI3_9RHOB|nr:cytosine permease [Paracoccus fistulariae]MDB6182537.1 cytosine permease [Paracoccus fistulariae]WCR07749.1 cytosine permease [Paracoccus fistulariae]
MRRSAATEDRQDFPLSEVPPSARKSFASLCVVLLGFTFFTATMFAGGRIGVAFPLWPDLVLIILTGNLLLGAYVAILGLIGYRTGLNTALLSRFSFGRIGARLPDLVLGLTQIGWYGWGTATMAVVLLRLIGFDPEANAALTTILILFFGMAFCWTAYIGYRGLEILSRISVPLMVLLLAVSLWIAIGDAGGIAGLSAIAPTAAMGIGTAITIVFGTFVSGGTQATNWTRFARRPSHAVWGALAAFFIGNGLMIATGAIGALVYQQPDVVDILAAQGLTFLGIIMLVLNLWTTQDNTIYNFSAVGCAALETDRRRQVTLIGAVIGTILALMRIDLYLIPFLLMLGTFIPPIGGVIMADYLYKHRGKYPLLAQASIPAINIPGLAAYVLGCLTAYLTPGIPPLNGILAAIIAYILADKILARSTEAN